MTTKLTKAQTINLLLNAYGFVHDCGMVYSCNESLISKESFTLQAPDQDVMCFPFVGATLCNGNVAFEYPDGSAEQFAVLIVATDSVNVDGQSVVAHLLSSAFEVRY